MNTKASVKSWFDKWEEGDFINLPISDIFTHTSPFGIIEGKEAYLHVVNENRDKFLGYKFEIQDEIYLDNKACVRYKASQNDFDLEVSEWYYIQDNLIDRIIAHYHIGEIKNDRKLKNEN